MAKEIIATNLTEEMVDIFLGDCIKAAQMCLCDQCRADVRAFALNHLPPRYVVTDAGGIFVRVSSMSAQNQANVVTAIMQGVQVVSSKPRHDPESSVFLKKEG